MHHQRVAALSHTVIECDNVEWHQCLRACVRAGADISSTYCNKDDVIWHVWLFWEIITASHVIVCCHSVNHSNIHLIIALRVNLTLQISQGSASTYVRWSGQFRYSFAEGIFRNSSSNFYWNRFIFHREGAKYKLAQFYETRCINFKNRYISPMCRDAPADEFARNLAQGVVS